MAEAFRWAFIGTGTLARKVIKEITASGRHAVVSAYSRNRQRLEDFCSPYGTCAATSVEDAVKRPDVDAVYISVTNESHYEICRKCLELGKPVLLEKPFTIKAEETERLQALAKGKGLYLSEAMWTWYSDVPNKVLELVRSGRLGKVKDVYMSYSRYSIDYAPRVSDPLLGGGALLDIGIYPITYSY
ncbi:MAG: Gfo/Idh/MocA family oxidoreductase [Spirochaetales bacterium]|nr:Gfo/Idh/MocA family oxidoreductase [Spirochaetales bacterium]